MNALEAELLALEQSLQAGPVRHDKDRLKALLRPEFREFGSSGKTFTRDEIVHALLAEAPVEILMTDFAVVSLGAEAALCTYRAEVKREEQPPSCSLRSSVWVMGPEGWRMLFHQGTRTG